MASHQIAEKPILITGASSGIGQASAIACAKAGMPVILAARRRERLDKLVNRITAQGGRATAITCDVTNPSDCDAAVEHAMATFGPLYAVFANAGIGLERSVADCSDDQIRHIFEVNFFSTLNTLRPAFPHLRSSPHTGPRNLRAHIIICSSCLARMAIPYYAAYTATKAAQAHVATAMRAELINDRVYVSSLHPVGTRTEFFDKTKDRSGSARLIDNTSDRFTHTPEFVATRVVRCLRNPKPEVWPGLTGTAVRAAMAFNTLLPSLGDRITQSKVRKRLNTTTRQP